MLGVTYEAVNHVVESVCSWNSIMGSLWLAWYALFLIMEEHNTVIVMGRRSSCLLNWLLYTYTKIFM